MGYITVQGRRAYYLMPEEAEAGANRGHTVLLVHGATDNHRAWSSQFQYLEREHTPIVLDLPGHGQSEGPGFDNSSDFREFIRAFVDAMGLGPFVFCGHSMGGSMALDYAIHYPEALEGFIMVGSSPQWEITEEKIALWRDEPARARREDLETMFSAKTPASIRERVIEESRTTPTEVCVADLKACNTYDLAGDVQKVRLPLLLLCGDEDEYSLEASRFVHSKLPHSILEVLQAAGHPVMIEQPERSNAVIGAFLETLT